MKTLLYILTYMIMMTTKSSATYISYYGMDTKDSMLWLSDTSYYDNVKLPTSASRLMNMRTARVIEHSELVENDLLFWKDKRGLVLGIYSAGEIMILNREDGYYILDEVYKIIRLVENVDESFLEMTAKFETNNGKYKASSIYLGKYCLQRAYIPTWSKKFLGYKTRRPNAIEQATIVMGIKEEAKEFLIRKRIPINKLTIRLYYNLGPSNFNKFLRGKLSTRTIRSNIGRGYKLTHASFQKFWSRKIEAYYA